jgi:hypothetical protein
VIFDSNRSYPDEDNQDVRQVISFCEQHSFSFHCLHKREIENYLPLRLVGNLLPGSSEQILSTFLQLTPEQQDYYDLDAGFKDKSKVPGNQSALFHDLSAESFKLIRDGFSSASYNVKQQFYKLFDDLRISSEHLLERCSHQEEPMELKAIIAKLLKRL